MSDPLDDLLRADARVLDEDLRSPGSDDGMDALWLEAKAAAAAPTTEVPRRGAKVRRRVTGAVAGLVVVGLGAGAAPAFADWVGLHTGEYDTGPRSAPQPKTADREMLRLNSPELARQLQAWEQTYPLAPGYSLDPLLDGYANVKRSEATAAMAHDDVFFFSQCTWVDYWLTADRDGDTAAKRAATNGLAGTVAKLDSVLTLDKPGRAYEGELVDAAQADKVAALQRERRINCDWKFR